MGHKYGLPTRLFIKMFPIFMLLSTLGGLNSLVDSIIAGRMIGVGGIEAIGFFFPINCILIAIGNALQGGSQIKCGNLLGRNNLDRSNSVFTLDITASFVISGTITAVCLLAPRSIASLLGASGSAVDGLSDYIRGMAPSFIPTMICSQASAFLQMDNAEKRSYVGIAFMTVTNAVLDVLFLKKYNMGLYGLGFASFFAYIVFLLILMPHYLSKKHTIRLDFRRLKIKDLVEVFKLGSPGALLFMCLFCRSVIINTLLFKYSGGDAVAAFAACSSFAFIIFAASNGTIDNTRVLSSIYAGEHDRTSLLETVRVAMTLGLGTAVLFMVIISVFARQIAGFFFTPDEVNAINLTAGSLRCMSVYMIFQCFNLTIANNLQSRGFIKFPLVVTFIDGFLAVSTAAVILIPLLGADGAWLAFVADGIVSALFVLSFISFKIRRFPRSFADLIALPDSFGTPENRRVDLTIHSMEEVSDTADYVMDFCIERGIPRKRAYHIAVCLEEMAGNIVRHGFTDNKNHTIDIRVVCKSNNLVLRISDDCISFNPKQFAEMMDNSDPVKNIGIRLVASVAKDFRYKRILGLNVLTIKA